MYFEIVLNLFANRTGTVIPSDNKSEKRKRCHIAFTNYIEEMKLLLFLFR